MKRSKATINLAPETFQSLYRDAERWRKLRESISRLGRLPTKFSEFIASTAGSNHLGLDEAMDAEPDLRK